MKTICLTIFLCLGAAALAQDIHFDYDRSADFSNYKTYQWAALRTGRATNQLMDQNIKRAVDEQLALKGLERVESGGDLQIAYQVEIEQEKQYDGFSLGPRRTGSLRVNSSTIDIGKLAVDLFDLENKQLVWHGVAEKARDIKKDPDKNYRSLQKAMAKLFKNYPPGSAK